MDLDRVGAATDQGPKRPDNQDRFLVKHLPDGGLLLAVADGMGGQAGGAVAAQMAVEGLGAGVGGTGMSPQEMEALVKVICHEIHGRASAEASLEGMGTTLTVATLSPTGLVRWTHVGDSRLYLIRGEELIQITSDDTVAAFLAEEGEITWEEAAVHPARHHLWDCVGCGDCEPRSGSFSASPGDLLLLSTDGLHDKLPAARILEVARASAGSRQGAQALVQEALRAGSTDNVTVIMAKA